MENEPRTAEEAVRAAFDAAAGGPLSVREVGEWIRNRWPHRWKDLRTPVADLAINGPVTSRYPLERRFLERIGRATYQVRRVESPLARERARRRELWERLLGAGGPKQVGPRLLRELGIYGAAQAVWVNQGVTGKLNGGVGVTVALLHQGRRHAEDLGERALLFHYPSTGRPGRDEGEIAATREALRLDLPVFVITWSDLDGQWRDVRLGRVLEANDELRVFYVALGDGLDELELPEDEDVRPLSNQERRRRLASVLDRGGQQAFRLAVFKRYGGQCAVCNVRELDLLEAAHLIPVSRQGSDEARNGLALCRNDHRALDLGLFVIRADDYRLYTPGPEGRLERLGILYRDLSHLPRRPSRAALRAMAG